MTLASNTVQTIARAIVAREGGFVNDPSDPGGATKYGVTIGTMQRLGMDLNKDGSVTIADVHLLTRGDAERLFIDQYYRRPQIDKLPQPLQATVFDMDVNAGSNAIRILQRLMPDFGYKLVADGALGPKSIGAVTKAYGKAGLYLVDAYGIARRNYYFRLADRRVASRKYARTRSGDKGGWIKRAEEFIRPKYHMTEAQFAERIKLWG